MSLIDRRGFLRAGGAGAVGFAVGGRRPSARPPARSRTGAPAFRHGVASGDPLPRSVIIWTRVTPTEESLPGSGRGPAVEVRWQVSADTAFRKIVATGVARTGPEADHTVKVDVTGLRPATAYYYRFLLGRRRSPTGRTRTAPAPSARVSGLCFGVVSCANWEAGYFSAYRHLAARDDVFGVIHLGDYLYEYGTGIATAAGTVIRVNVPAHEIVSLADYRMRHALYKTDPDLQALHARHPWMVVWDDHELANDAWSGGAQNHFPAVEGPWSTRRAAARQAYFEWMPIRVRAGGVIYRRLRFGRLAELTLLDLRSFRSKPVWWTDTRAPGRTMTGRAQMTWLKEALSASRDETRWRLVGNSVMMAPLAPGSFPAQQLNALNRLVGIPESTAGVDTDHWDGFPADRSELLAHLYDRNIANTVFLTGDVHTSWANDLPLDAAGYPAAPSVAAEFVVPSVTSDNFGDLLRAPPRTVSIAAEGLIAAANPHVRWCDLDAHGFGVLDLRPERALMSWYRISDRTRRDASVAPLAAFAVAGGVQRLRSV